MIQNIQTDPAALKAQLIRRHGEALAAVLLPIELAQRDAEDVVCEGINAELAKLDDQLAECAARFAARLTVLQSQWDAADKARNYAGAQIEAAELVASQERTPLQTRIDEIRQSYAATLARRQAEIDLRLYGITESVDARMVAAVSKKEVAACTPALTGLALINSQVPPGR